MASYSTAATDKLWNLLPAILRERDAEEGFPLRALLAIAEEQVDAIEADAEQLLRNAFVETAEPWAVPYIGALLGTTPLAGGGEAADGATAEALFEDLEGPSLAPSFRIRTRADTLKTVYYRRRKATLPMLEELARDVTGWPAHAVEFFERVVWSQWVPNRLRPHALATPDVRSVEAMDRLGGPFEGVCRTVDVRPPGQFEGWENIPNVGFFLWRLAALECAGTSARRLGPVGDFRYHVCVLGNDAPLFSRTRREGDEAGLATELHVPQPIRPARFHADLAAYRALPAPRPGFTAFYGALGGVPGLPPAPEASLFVVVDGVPVEADAVTCRNLSTWTQPGAAEVAIDVALGRLALGAGFLPADEVRVWHFSGFPGELGGGGYRRTAWLVREGLADAVYRVADNGAGGAFQTIGAALAAWVADGRPTAVVRIEDNGTYAETLSIAVDGAAGRFLAIEAADGVRPHLAPPTPVAVTGVNEDFSLTLSGLLVEGRVAIEGSISRLRLLHATLVPGVSVAVPDPDLPPPPPAAVEPSVTAVDTIDGAPANTELRLEMAFSVTGPLALPERGEGLFLLDSIVDGRGEAAIAGSGAGPDASGPVLHAERTTVRGAVRVRAMALVSETILDGPATVSRTQAGCVRFSYVAPGSTTPRRYRCHPDMAEEAAIAAAEAASGPLADAARATIRARERRRVAPDYTAEDYGAPAYLQLALAGPAEIATGAEDGSEMGAWCHLKQPQREANLKLRLEEYLPFGLDGGIVYVT